MLSAIAITLLFSPIMTVDEWTYERTHTVPSRMTKDKIEEEVQRQIKNRKDAGRWNEKYAAQNEKFLRTEIEGRALGFERTGPHLVSAGDWGSRMQVYMPNVSIDKAIANNLSVYDGELTAEIIDFEDLRKMRADIHEGDMRAMFASPVDLFVLTGYLPKTAEQQEPKLEDGKTWKVWTSVGPFKTVYKTELLYDPASPSKLLRAKSYTLAQRPVSWRLEKVVEVRSHHQVEGKWMPADFTIQRILGSEVHFTDRYKFVSLAKKELLPLSGYLKTNMTIFDNRAKDANGRVTGYSYTGKLKEIGKG
ncbi:MAG: hypothetical protein U0R49_01280 [Fimbriimonadales bacterium]